MASPEELLKLEEHLCELSGYLREIGRKPCVCAGVKLTNGEAHTLMEVAGQEGLTQTELARKMFRGKAATSLAVDSLEEKGLIVRQKKSVHCYLALTDLGWKVYRARLARDLRRANQMAEELPVELEELAEANEVLAAVIHWCHHGHYTESEEE